MLKSRLPPSLDPSKPCLCSRGARAGGTPPGPLDRRAFHLQLRTLGEVSVRGSDGQGIGSLEQQPKRVALLTYLAVSAPRRFQRRDSLLALFWPERDAAHARAALRQALHGLRQELGDGVVVARGDDEVGIDTAELWCDAVDFEDALRSGNLHRTVALSAGPFLDGFHVKDVPDFDRWTQATRDNLERGYAVALEGLAEREAARGHALCSVEWWRQLTDLEPYSSRYAVRFMEALASVGERAEAIRHATRHAGLLRQVFDADPDPRVQALANRLRNQRASIPR